MFFFTVLISSAVLALASAGSHPAQAPTYTVNYGDKACFILSAHITYNFTFENTTVSGTFGSEGNVTTVGDCTNETASITIIETGQTPNVSITLDFSSNAVRNIWSGDQLTLLVDTVYSMANISFMSAAMGQQYACAPQRHVLLTDGSLVGAVHFSNVHLQPFEVVNGTLSSKATNCAFPQPNPSNIVPIAVGAGLCLLVVIVILSYIIGRARHSRRTSGYQSVDGETH